MIESLFRSKCDMLFLKGEEVMLAWKEYCLRDANSLVCQLENELGRTSWEKIDNPARLKFVDDCIHLVGLFERENKHEWKGENGPEETLSAIQNGEEELRVNDVVDDDNVKLCTEDLKQTNTNFMDIFSEPILRKSVQVSLPNHFIGLSAEERTRWTDRVWQLLVQVYEGVQGGLHFASPEDMLDETHYWEILQQEGQLLAVLLYKVKHGQKIVALAATPHGQNRKAVLAQLGQHIRFCLQYAWIEVSEKVEQFVLRHGGNSMRIANQYAEHLTGKPILALHEDGYHYTREICGINKQKQMIGTVSFFPCT